MGNPSLYPHRPASWLTSLPDPALERTRGTAATLFSLSGRIVKTVTLDVRPPAETMVLVQAWQTGKGSKAARISFASPKLLWKELTAKRRELLEAV